MADIVAASDDSHAKALIALSNAADGTFVQLWADPITHRLLVDNTGGAGSGTVTSVSVVSANGFAGTVATATTTPAITISTTITGVLIGNGTAISAATTTGTGNVVLATAPSISGATITTSSVNGVTLTTGGGTTTFLNANGAYSTPASGGSPGGTNTQVQYNNAGAFGGISGVITNGTSIQISSGDLLLEGSSSGGVTLNAPATGGGTLTLPAGTDTLAGLAATQAFTNKTYNGLAITSSTGTLTIAAGKTATVSNTLTFTGTDASSVAFGTGGTVLYSASTIPLTIGTTTIASGSNGFLLYNNSGVLGNLAVSATPAASTISEWDANKNFSANAFIPGFTTTATAGATTTLTIASTEMQVFTGILNQTLVLPSTSVVAGTSYTVINQSTGSITVQASGGATVYVLGAQSSGTFTANTSAPTSNTGWTPNYRGTQTLTGKTAIFNNSLIFAGTDSTTMTFPGTSATVARTDAAQTFTGTQTFSQVVTTVNAITAVSNAATVPITSRISNVTNNSAATLTITLATTSAVDGQLVMVRIYDFSAVAQTLTFVNTENSTVSVPTTSNGSTTLPLTVGFQFNSATTKWRCIASV